MPRDDDLSSDRLYAKTQRGIEDFTFDAKTATVFDDMLNRSVPLYGEIQRLIGELAGDFATDGTTVYDLGCSTGTTLVAIAHHLPSGLNVRFVGIDSSEEMLDKARAKLTAAKFPYAYELRVGDLDHGLMIEEASVVDLFATPRHPYTKGLLASIPRMDDESHGELYAIPGMVPDIHDLPAGCRFADRCFQADERCRAESPPLTDLDGDRSVACFFPLSPEA